MSKREAEFLSSRSSSGQSFWDSSLGPQCIMLERIRDHPAGTTLPCQWLKWTDRSSVVTAEPGTEPLPSFVAALALGAGVFQRDLL